MVRPAAIRDLKGLPAQILARIEKAIGSMPMNPRPPGAKKLVGYEREWRLRVGDYRILYVLDDASRQIIITRIPHRREAYR
jgi:mRNA interferase RelE/StbE